MQWFRWYHGTCNDPKWPVVARKAGVHKTVVVAVWAMLEEYASERDDRGTVDGFDVEEAAGVLDLPTEQVSAVLAAMGELSRPVLERSRIVNWDRYQFKSDNVTARTKRFKQRAPNDAGTPKEPPSSVPTTPRERSTNTPETETETDQNRNTAAPVLQEAPREEPKAEPTKPEAPKSSIDDPLPTFLDRRPPLIIKAFDDAIARHFGEEQRRGWPNATDALTAKGWLDSGIDPSLCASIFDATMQRMAAQSKSPPGSLSYFDRPIREAHANRGKPVTTIPLKPSTWATEDPWTHAEEEHVKRKVFPLLHKAGRKLTELQEATGKRLPDHTVEEVHAWIASVADGSREGQTTTADGMRPRAGERLTA